MVKPTDRDVVFHQQAQTQTQTAQQDDHHRYCNTTGNRIYRGLLEEYYDRYHHPLYGTPTHQKEIRKLIVDNFHERTTTSAATATETEKETNNTVNQNNNNDDNGGDGGGGATKAQFLIHMKQGTSFYFTKVYFKNKIDEKIVS